MKGKYDDIIDMPHHVSNRHPQMSMEARAAQFAPFAALTGHSDAIGHKTHEAMARYDDTDDSGMYGEEDMPEEDMQP